MRQDPTTGQFEYTNLAIKPHDIPANDPELRRQLILLQYMDVLSGQADRSNRNYFVGRDANGKVVVTAIDNDMAWGTYPKDAREIAKLASSVLQMQSKGLPPIADAEIIRMFNTMTANDLATELGDQLSPEQLAAAQGRLQAIKDHLANLKPTNIVANWGSTADNIFDKELDDRNCYLKRDEHYFKPATQPQTPPSPTTGGTVSTSPQTTATPTSTGEQTSIYIPPEDL